MLSLHPAQFPSPSLQLSLIYIAMTPVSVMQAPCCEFHLSRKTSGDCYANGYVVGLGQEWKGKKNGDVCILVCASGGSQSGKNKREVGTTRKRRDAKEMKNRKRRNKNQDTANADRVVWQDVLWRSIKSCVWEREREMYCIGTDWLGIFAFNLCLSMSLIMT